MSKVSVFAKFSCQQGKGSEMDEALGAIVAASESVDGVESYSYHRGDDGTYWFFALMSSMEAAQQHADNEAMQTAMPALMALLAGPPDMAMTTPLAANGFDI
ncbi:MAG: antibiotic biosynthesis monooxygenase [Acidimicrobiaceae bacterium]|nr:antibiotic biosynthesis monooxygenase [Acidimicrobiaceae bacterium]